jgi:hypothetical protein
MDTFAELSNLKHLSMVVNVLAAAGDVLIALILCVMLHVSRTGYKKYRSVILLCVFPTLMCCIACRSDTIINRLIAFSVNTGLLTSVCAVMSLVSVRLFIALFGLIS